MTTPSNTPKRPLSDRLLPLLLGILALSMLATLAVFAYTGTFSRFMADDFCYANTIRQMGWLGGQTRLYNTWSGRISSNFLIAVLEPFGASAAPIMPAIALLLWLVGLYGLIASVIRNTAFPRRRLLAFGLAAVVLYFTLLTTPDRNQVLYWMNGQIAYALPLIAVTFLAALITNRLNRSEPAGVPFLLMLAALLLAFLAGGFSETNSALQVGMVVLALLLFVSFSKGLLRVTGTALLAVVLIGSLAAMALVILAPGNLVRQSVVAIASPAFPVLVITSIEYAWDFIFNALKSLPIPFLLVIGISFLAAFLSHAGDHEADETSRSLLKKSWKLVLVPIVAYLLIVCCMAPSEYAESAYPEGRALLSATFVLIMTLVVLSVWLGIIAKKLIASSSANIRNTLLLAALLLCLVMSIYPLHYISETALSIKRASLYANAWDKRQSAILQAASLGQRDVVVKPINSLYSVMEAGNNDEFWVNTCIASYYDIHTLIAK
jgi:cytochrome bd-type quinol oxidase subunit 2